jgi:hypothetical protein
MDLTPEPHSVHPTRPCRQRKMRKRLFNKISNAKRKLLMSGLGNG